MEKESLIKRYLVFIAGLYFLAMGISLHIPEHTRSLSGSLLGYKTIP